MKAWVKDKLKNKKLVVLAVAIVLALVALIWFTVRPSPAPSYSKPNVITHSTDTPDETKPAENSYEWRGGPDDPKYIKLPTINAEGFIQNVGVDQNKQVAVPNNIHMAGWFKDSVKPGQKGLSIVDGHLNGRSNDGIFVNLEDIKKDDVYTVEFGNGSTKKFKVAEVVTVDTKEAASVLFSQNPKVTNQLNLITCGGNFDPKARLYDKRVVVTSELVQ